MREQIEVRVAGKITYDGPTMPHVLQVWLAGTEPIDLLADVTPLEAAVTFNLNELFLDKYPRKVVVSLTLKPGVVSRGEILKRKLIFLDSNGRKFKVGPMVFPYNPGLRRVNSDGKIRPVDPEGAW